jgi:hypothetical protein
MLTYSLIEGRDNSKDKTKYETANMSGFTRKQHDVKKQLDRLLKIGEMPMRISPGAGICSIGRDIEQNKITPMSMAGASSSENKIKPSIFAMLEELYFDIFHQTSSVNPKSPQFIEMSEYMKHKIYKNDVQQLYMTVTGKDTVPIEIKTFADVSQHINENDEIKKWCDVNKNMQFNVNDNIRSDSGFVEYINHIKSMMYFISKQRNGIVSLLDKVFVTVKKSDEEMRQLEENWDKGGLRRNEGFEKDDEYARKFFRSNLRLDFFINPNLTDADLQVIINEARTRIVKLYADSYKQFYKGFEILQKIQARGEIVKLEKEQELAKKGQEIDASQKINTSSGTFDQAMEISQKILDKLSNSSIASKFSQVFRIIKEKGRENPTPNNRANIRYCFEPKAPSDLKSRNKRSMS